MAALDALDGDRADAIEHLDAVSRLNPREGLTGRVRNGLEQGQPLTLKELDAAFLERFCSRAGRRATSTGCESGRD